jgi:hypothetical protein
MQKGTVVFCRDFVFDDGAVDPKLLIILNDFKEGYTHIAVLITSIQGNYPFSTGCHASRNVFVIEEHNDFFTKRTYVQINRIVEYDPQVLQKKISTKRIKIEHILKEETINRIIECVKKSIDVEINYLKIIEETNSPSPTNL